MLEKTYEAAAVEPRISADWDAAKAFAAGAGAKPGAETYTIVIPPPNVTGSLHMGHALNNTLQDILVRFERMRGKDVLWQPGTDHAGIATQMVVERQMASRQEPGRREIGREAFLEKVWTWKAESGGTIVNQLKRLGASCDWSRERFTMDEGLSRAVLKVFVQLHRDGLIYRDKRLVNWDPHFETAISDLEVLQVEVKGHFWHFKYPIEGQPHRFITVATTRPETMLGDTAVAVHPEDERYADLIGKFVILPLVGRRIPIVADEYSDPEKGTGAVKITPAHDFNDFEVGKRHGLAMINILDRKARIDLAGNEAFWADVGHGSELSGAPVAGEDEEALSPVGYVLAAGDLEAQLHGLEREKARKLVVELMQRRGLVEKIEPNTHTVPHGDRSNVVIEPFLTDQWYVNAAELAKPALAAVRDGVTTFVPKNWENTYYQWMENIQPWCVSRQLWWGHQIPAWYGPDGEVFVAHDEREALDAAIHHYLTRGDIDAAKASALRASGAAGFLTRDEDVLDTWFSSALWPFSTLGWPEKTQELKKFYPTSTLITAHDIIFFWVARMMMLGMHFMKEVPFHEVYIHALVRDAKGAKMSKSKGNTMDPLDLIDKYGADALRFTLAAMAAQGRDIKLSEQRIEGYRNFGTKLWNAARFAQMNECAVWDSFDPRSPQQTVNRWIVGETAKTVETVTRELEGRRFNEAAGALYKFVWNVYCDWYLEFIKPLLNGADEAAKLETRRTAAWVLDQILIMLHPFMPFITEELWARTAEYGQKRDGMLITEAWPALSPDLVDSEAEAEIQWMVALIEETRSTRSELNVPPAAKVPLLLIGADDATEVRLERYQDLIDRMARLEYSTSAKEAPAGSVTFVLDGATVALPLEGVVDLPAEAARLAKDIAKLEGEISKMDAKLGNSDFIAKAPEEVVDELRERREDAATSAAKLSAALAQIKSAA